MPSKTVTGTVPEDEDLAELFGEGIHTAMRKGTDGPGAQEVWKAINECDGQTWHDALLWFLFSMRQVGFEVVQVDVTDGDG